ncbi:MAG: polyhydroxyalkanoate synthesis repressor PhaR [Steroidobacteraceae bacterium]
MSEPRIIKKYPNRRLYDTIESRYITLGDVRRLVLQRVEFVVIDRKTSEDITRPILLQVIAEQEHSGEALMSRDFLSQVICSYGDAAQGLLGSYLEQSLKLFSAQQQALRDRARMLTGTDPLDTVASIAQKNYQRWRTIQDEIFRTLVGAAGRSADGEQTGAR